MPISPKNKKRYPKDWALLRINILARAGNRCEGSPAYPDCRAQNYEAHPVTKSKVILTIAHLDHMPENNESSNLKALCQRCHLAYDMVHHLTNRKFNKLDLSLALSTLTHTNIVDKV